MRTKRGMRGASTAVGAVVVALLLAACGGGPGGAAGSSAAAQSSTPTSTPSPTVDWVDYQTPDGSATWELPPDWTVDVGTVQSMATGENVPQYTVRDPDGVARVRLSVHIGGIGGPGCEVMSPLYPYAKLDALDPDVSVPGHVWFETIDTPSGVAAALHLVPVDAVAPSQACGPDWGFVDTGDKLGIISWAAIAPLPAPVDPVEDAAAFAALPTDEAGTVISFATPADAQSFLDTELYQTLRRILGSLRLTGP